MSSNWIYKFLKRESNNSSDENLGRKVNLTYERL